MRRLSLLFAIAAAAYVSAAGADPLPPTAPAAPAAHKVGQTFAYVLQGHVSQSIDGRDPFGHRVHQTGAPTSIDGHENITITGIAPASGSLRLRRSGSVYAIVSGHKKGVARTAWTIVSPRGSIVRDNNKLGGIFLLPLPFLGSESVKSGAGLSVGDAWGAALPIKLFGMISVPTMRFHVLGARSVLGFDVYTISATGSAPMKEPIVTNAGYAMGYALGTAWLAVRADYDFTNRRVVSMTIDVRDTLQLFGSHNKVAGTVRDRQRYDVALDADSLMAGSRQRPPTDPGVDGTGGTRQP